MDGVILLTEISWPPVIKTDKKNLDNEGAS